MKAYLIFCIFLLSVSGCHMLDSEENDNANATPTENETPASCEVAGSPFGGGTGTTDDPYLICTATQLDQVREHMSSSFKLTSDIDLNGVSFDPIGDGGCGSAFTGTFDGNHKTISNWSFSGTFDCIAFVEWLSSGATAGEIKNLTLQNINLTSTRGWAGGFVGWAEAASKLTNVHAAGSLSAGSNTGGLIGEAEGAVAILNSSSAVNISSTGDQVGGLIGRTQFSAANITNSFNTGSVTSSKTLVGGLVGYHQGGTIFNSYSTGNITGRGYDLGGLMGYAYGIITNCYATGNVTNSHAINAEEIGGLIGGSSATVTNSYSTGLITTVAGTDIGGLIGGTQGGSVTNSFWDTDTSLQPTSAGGAGAMGKTTAEMQTQATFTDAGWDFDTVWQLSGGGYPTLK